MNSLIRDFNAYWRSVAPDAESEPRERRRWLTSGENAISLDSENGDRFDTLCDDLNAFCNRKDRVISRYTVTRLLETAIFDALDLRGRQSDGFDSRLERAMTTLKEKFSAAPELWTVRMQVLGIASASLPIPLGSVTLFEATPEFINRLPGGTPAVKPDAAGNNVGAGDQQNNFIRQLLTDRLAGFVVGEVKVLASDSDTAVVNAEKMIRRAIEILNLFTTTFLNDRVRAYLPGSAGSGKLFAVAELPGKSASYNDSLIGPFEFSPISWLSLDSKNKSIFEEAIRLLEKEAPNPAENRILAAMQWAGRAGSELMSETAFLLFAIALESLLLGPGERGELLYRLRTRCAWLLGVNGEDKKEIFDDVGKLYGIRSKIVHTGNMAVSDDELNRIRLLATEAILTVLDDCELRNMKSNKGFDDWFENRVLGELSPVVE